MQFNTDPGFVRLNPKKVIFVGAKIVHQSCAGTRLDDTLSRSKKWPSNNVRVCTAQRVGNTFVTQLAATTVDEALNHQMPRRPWSFERYHGLYVVTQ